MDTPTRKKNQELKFTEEIETSKAEIKESEASLKSRLEHIKSKEGVIGYILRASTSASVDVKDPSKIIDYALLSAAAFDSGASLSNEFSLGKTNYIVLEGKDAKILSMTIGEQTLSVFMEKSVNHNLIYKELV